MLVSGATGDVTSLQRDRATSRYGVSHERHPLPGPSQCLGQQHSSGLSIRLVSLKRVSILYIMNLNDRRWNPMDRRLHSPLT